MHLYIHYRQPVVKCGGLVEVSAREKTRTTKEDSWHASIRDTEFWDASKLLCATKT